MKKIFKTIITLAFLSTPALAQENSQLPVDKETKLISYTEVVEMPGMPKDSLYKRAERWFRSYYKNPADVIKEQDPAKGSITGVHRFKVTKDVPSTKKNEPPVKNDAGLVSYTISVAAKDGKYRYEITKINWKQISHFPIEKWQDTKSPSYDPAYAGYLTQTDEYMKKLVEDLKKGMSYTGKQKSDW